MTPPGPEPTRGPARLRESFAYVLKFVLLLAVLAFVLAWLLRR